LETLPSDLLRTRNSYDLVVPYFLPLSALPAANLPLQQFVHRLYPTGHAVLNDRESRATATDDIRAFYATRSPSAAGVR
jgi:hypothetical protein